MVKSHENLEFQLYDWLESHDVVKDEDGDYDGDEDLPGEFIIHSFGRCDDGKSVYAKITNFTPYFYILLPNKIQKKSKHELKIIVSEIKNFFKSKQNKKVFYKFKSTLNETQLVKLKRAEGFNNDKEFWFARLVFSNAEGMKKYRSYLEYNEISIPNVKELIKPFKFKLYEANLPPMFRCFHIREISGCSWVETSSYDIITDKDSKESRCDIEIIVDWRNLNPIIKDHNAPFRICSFDLECTSIDGEFPQARRKGDRIIQIGATYTLIGNSVPYRQYIACLDNTSAVENTIVESCQTEQELMLKFLDEINNNDCDILTGYNIFFFDEKYMYDRCKEILNIDCDMAYMSKLKNHKCNFKEMKLSSSALGENLLRFWDTPGRIHIDLMKDVQKTFNLSCYKLDYVASKFIRGDVLSFSLINDDKIEITCKDVSDLYVGDYMHLEVTKGFVSDNIGEKYFVISVNTENKQIIIKGDKLLFNELNKEKLNGVISWSQAKDDVGPKDIFRLQKGSADDRAIVAKYCVKDCKLVNLLINKLEVVTKNIEMANVCSVPLSFLFIRGQGIKLFSLCLKEFRKQKYAFPVIKVDKLYRCPNCKHEYQNKWQCPKCYTRDRDEIESETSSYEGAIVFDPVPKVEYEALATKDYASLYPASILHKNMSHETIVEDPEYDNLPGIKYYNANFRESDGSIQHRRFAQIDNNFGVIPTILNNLLKTRKIIKKLMSKEKDPFKYKILDAKQLAVKVTANSLYGQLGASTSPVCKRDIAACTTSTGREMLILAKKYDEEKLPWIMNGLKYFYANNDIEKINHMYNLELKSSDQVLINNIKTYITNINNLTFQPIIRYGDSVVGYTPLLLRYKKYGYTFVKTIESLKEPCKFVPMERNNCNDNKESCEINDIETWTEEGWKKIHRVIRHKLAKHKRLFRITTYSGSVIVTDDHSLITSCGKEIKPRDVKIGIELLHSFPMLSTHRKMKYPKNIISPMHTCFSDKTFTDDLSALEYCIECKRNNIKYTIESAYDMIIVKHYDNDSIIESKLNEIRQIEEWFEEEEYVYDLTTDNHHFHAGVGSIIVHNTDSIFSCYRFRENTVKVDKETALKIWKKVIGFAKILIEPYFGKKERNIFNNIFDTYYSDEKIYDLTLPEPPNCMDEPSHNAIILPLEERLKQFIKEYMQESYIPWLWTLAELVEKNYTYMFDIKLTQWAEHQLSKIRLNAENLDDNRKNYLMKPLQEYINTLFDNKYIMPSDKAIYDLVEKFNKENTDCFPYAHEIIISKTILSKSCKNLLEKTIKEKWIYSGEKKELTKIIHKFLLNVTNEPIKDNSQIINFITKFISENKNIDLIKMCELLIKNLISDENMNISFDEEKLNIHTKDFVELYNKNNGKKTMDEILELFLTKEIGIDFTLYKSTHYNTVINFINTHMRREDMTVMNDNGIQYIYYWLQPRWDFNIASKQIIRCIDIHEGGLMITDKRTLEHSMEMGKLSGELIKSHLPFPHDCEYEKTFWPFAILTKKRYVGNKYEFDSNKYKQDFMGIVLKRRDNSAIVKEICGGIIDYLINHKSPKKATDYTRKCLQDMFDGKYDIKYFLTSKTLKLKESYKDWKRISHVYLADKISQRDPGNTPQSGDRIEFAVIQVPMPTNGIKLLQGDIIETPKFIKEQNLKLDYLFYLTNQIMNPALQFLELVDKNAIDIFNEFINKYSIPKIKKEKPVKPVKEKPVKPVKEKPVKQVKEKPIKPNKEKSALDILIHIKNNNKYVNDIQHFINEIQDFMINNKIDKLMIDPIFNNDGIIL
jgi:DNA polymerase elongation subunit (family B)